MHIGAMRWVANALAVPSTTTVYTNSFPIGFALYFGLWLKVAGTGPDIKIELEESRVLPATEGSSDANWIEPDGASDISSGITDNAAHIFTLSPKPMPLARFRLTGQNANPAGATIDMYVFIQEPS